MTRWLRTYKQFLSNRQGFTLVEIIVAMVIFSLVMGTAYTMFYQGARLTNQQTGQAEARSDVRLVLTQLTKEIQEAVSVTTTASGAFVFTQPNNDRISFYFDHNRGAVIRNLNGQEAIFLDSVTNPFVIASTDNKDFRIELNTLNLRHNLGNPEKEKYELTVSRRTGRVVGAGITSVTPKPNQHTTGSLQLVVVEISTRHIDNGTGVTVELVTSGGASLSPAVIQAGTVNKDKAAVVLTIPDTVAAGSYRIKVIAGDLIHDLATYLITVTQQPNNAEAFTYYEGKFTGYTKAELELTKNATIKTDGMLFIPASYGTVSLSNQVAVFYFARYNGVFIGASIETQAANSHITIRSCAGPVEMDGVTLKAGTGQADILVEAGTYISAKDTKLDSRNVAVRANGDIHLNDATVKVNDSITLAYSGKLFIGGANFEKKTPAIITPLPVPITCN